MKKRLTALFIAAALMLCSFALAETIAPVKETVDLKNGTYPASFDRSDFKKDELRHVTLYTVDIYDIVDISKMAVGDSIVIDGQTIEITSIDHNEYGDILINRPADADTDDDNDDDDDDEEPVDGYNDGSDDGYLLTTDEDTNGWRVAGDDDFPTYTDHGEVTLKLDKDVVFNDAWDIDSDPVTVKGAKEVEKAIKKSENDYFSCYNTEIVIENGKVIQIDRRYTP